MVVPVETPLRYVVVAKDSAPPRTKPTGRRYKEVLSKLTAKGHTAIVEIDTQPEQTASQRYEQLRQSFRHHAKRVNKRVSIWRDGDYMCIELLENYYAQPAYPKEA